MKGWISDQQGGIRAYCYEYFYCSLNQRRQWQQAIQLLYGMARTVEHPPKTSTHLQCYISPGGALTFHVQSWWLIFNGGREPPVAPKVLNELLDNILSLHIIKIICSNVSTRYAL
ncbi:unnamed protein product, partial [Ceratitis capitata]